MADDTEDAALRAAKVAARRAAEARRATALAQVAPGAPAARLVAVLAAQAGRVLAGYMPMRSEADPLPAMAAHRGPLCLPVVVGRGLALEFRAWAPGAALVAGAFGARIPAAGAMLLPEVLVVPALAFDPQGFRLGYGGGFYDRTLAALRARGPVLAIGFGLAGQIVEAVPRGPHDAPLDLIVTEAGVLNPHG